MRTHGWGGAAPASDQEAIDRILAAASQAIDTRGADISIADVARTLGVTRQTVYRYFPSTDALLIAAATQAAARFLDRLARHVAGITDPSEAVVEGIATALEWLPKDKHIGLVLAPGRASAFSADVTSDVAVQFGQTMIRRFDVDWAAAGFTDNDLVELTEHLLRIIQSFSIDPGRPPRSGAAGTRSDSGQYLGLPPRGDRGCSMARRSAGSAPATSGTVSAGRRVTNT